MPINKETNEPTDYTKNIHINYTFLSELIRNYYIIPNFHVLINNQTLKRISLVESGVSSSWCNG